MKWSPYIPTLAGFYWVKCKGELSGKEYVQVAKVYKCLKDSTGVDTLYLEGDNYTLFCSNTLPANVVSFAGPIPFPEE